MKKDKIVSLEYIQKRIYIIRGQRVMLDSDLAEIYGVETKMLNRAVRRNKERFPQDFMFQLTKEEFENLRFQIGTSSWGGRRYLPYVFTEHGAVMLASVLNTPKAVQMSIFVVRAFIKMREMLSNYKELAKKLEELEKKVVKHDSEIKALFEAIKQLMLEPQKPKRRIGFV